MHSNNKGSVTMASSKSIEHRVEMLEKLVGRLFIELEEKSTGDSDEHWPPAWNEPIDR